jgi:hypothetical protein
MGALHSEFDFLYEVECDVCVSEKSSVLVFGPSALNSLKGAPFMEEFSGPETDGVHKYWKCCRQDSVESVKSVIEFIRRQYTHDWQTIYVYKATKTVREEFSREWPNAKIRTVTVDSVVVSE